MANLTEWVERTVVVRATAPAVKRPKGRPAGSKNLTEAERLERYKALHPYGHGRRGRPQGSRNRSHDITVRPVTVTIGKAQYDGVEFVNGHTRLFLNSNTMPVSYQKSRKTYYVVNGMSFAINGLTDTDNGQAIEMVQVVAPEDSYKRMNMVVNGVEVQVTEPATEDTTTVVDNTDSE